MNRAQSGAAVVEMVSEAERLCTARQWAAAAAIYEQMVAEVEQILALAKSCRAEGNVKLAKQLLIALEDVPSSPVSQAAARVALAEIDDKPYDECPECHCVSTNTIAFQKVGGRRLCPTCTWRTEQQHGSRPKYLLALLGIIVAGILLTRTEASAYGFLVLNLGLGLVLLPLFVFAHEVAHGLASLLLGGRVFGAQIGVGPKVYESRSAYRYWLIGLYPLGAGIFVAFEQRHLLRLRYFLTAAAAPFMHLAIVLLLWPLFDLDRVTTGVALLEVIWFMNAVLLIGNLLPFESTLMGGKASSDGLQMLNLLIGRTKASDLEATYQIVLSGQVCMVEHYEEALQVTEAGLQRNPNNVSLRINHSAALIGLNRYADVCNSVEAVLPLVEQGSTQMAKLLNNAAYALLHLQHVQDRISHSYDYAQQAFWLAPWIPAIEETLAADQIERGRIACGLAHLDLAAKRDPDVSAARRAGRLAWTAIGHSRLGDVAKAKAALEQALVLDPSHFDVQLATREIAGVGDTVLQTEANAVAPPKI